MLWIEQFCHAGKCGVCDRHSCSAKQISVMSVLGSCDVHREHFISFHFTRGREINQQDATNSMFIIKLSVLGSCDRAL